MQINQIIHAEYVTNEQEHLINHQFRGIVSTNEAICIYGLIQLILLSWGSRFTLLMIL